MSLITFVLMKVNISLVARFAFLYFFFSETKLIIHCIMCIWVECFQRYIKYCRKCLKVCVCNTKSNHYFQIVQICWTPRRLCLHFSFFSNGRGNSTLFCSWAQKTAMHTLLGYTDVSRFFYFVFPFLVCSWWLPDGIVYTTQHYNVGQTADSE